MDMTQEFAPINPGPVIAEEDCAESDSPRHNNDPRFMNYCFKVANSCCCGLVSLKHALVFLCVFDLTLGLASAGIVFMVIEE